jgi:hypothetical protein
MPCHCQMKLFIKVLNGWIQNIMLNRHFKDFMNHISVLLITSATTCVITCVSMVGINVILLHFRPFICIPQHISDWKYILEILYWMFTWKYFKKIRIILVNLTGIWGTLHKESRIVHFWRRLLSQERSFFKGMWYQFRYDRRNWVNVSRICQIVTSYTSYLFCPQIIRFEFITLYIRQHKILLNGRYFCHHIMWGWKIFYKVSSA